ncbi:hypothetical protein [Scytonema sp. PCC 10023]|uniref:hypothetical protein n=1 Tax=Scytonema sp. PCC 10023 TaxID=1680591 RepID=UPI0039C6BA59
MANLTFRSILSTGSRALGEGAVDGADRFDLFFDNIDLSGFADIPALLLLATRNVDEENNFITINAPGDVTNQSLEAAQDEDYFVSRILANPSDTWILQIHRIPSGILNAANNILGIHCRNANGETSENRDNFSVARIFLVYFGAEN